MAISSQLSVDGPTGTKGVAPATTSRFVKEHVKKSDMVHYKMTDFYKLQQVLGEGGFATVYQGTHRITKKVFAVKSIDLYKIHADKLDMLRNEVEVMKLLDHPNIVRLYETYEEEDKLHLILELCEGGDLFDYLMKSSIEPSGEKTWSDGDICYVLTEKRVASLVRKIMSAINYLHLRGIAHRDIKPENFLLESKANIEGPGEIKVIDFGFSKVFHGTEDMHNMLGSPYYVAPEVLNASAEQGYGSKCDMWSLGVVVYMMLCGQPPFFGDDNAQIYEQIGKGTYEYPEGVTVSDEAKDFLSHLMEKDPEVRYSAMQALQHTWLLSVEERPETPLQCPPSMLKQLSKAHEISRLKREALLAIGYSLDRDAIREMRNTFRAFDTEGNGVISLEELQEAMRKHGIEQEEINTVFKTLSPDDPDGHIDYTSFVAACLEKKSYLEQSRLYEAFRRFQDNRGYVTAESLKEILGDRFSHKQACEMVEEADIDHDGRISFSEFSLMMGNRLPVNKLAWRELPLLENLSVDEVGQVLEISHQRTFESGEDLLKQGELSHSFFIIDDGEVEVSRDRTGKGLSPIGSSLDVTAILAQAVSRSPSTDNLSQNLVEGMLAAQGGDHHETTRDTIVLLGKNSVVGEMEFVQFDAEPPAVAATVTATTAVRSREVPYDLFKKLLDGNPQLGYKIMTNIARIAAKGLAQMNRQFSHFGQVLDMYANNRAKLKVQHCRGGDMRRTHFETRGVELK
uniref:cGMP-dependent protein kinase n=2 Tax=Hemiselmis andersenii TaxID=464988 RepID=A0A7S1GW29_HEMAN